MNPIKKELEIQGHRYAKENEKVRMFDSNPRLKKQFCQFAIKQQVWDEQHIYGLQPFSDTKSQECLPYQKRSATNQD